MNKYRFFNLSAMSRFIKWQNTIISLTSLLILLIHPEVIGSTLLQNIQAQVRKTCRTSIDYLSMGWL